jgi:hypothetical protein
MQSTVEQVLGRLLTDGSFRSQVMAAPEQALASYNLGQDEMNALGQLDLAAWTNIQANSDGCCHFPDITGGRRTL